MGVLGNQVSKLRSLRRITRDGRWIPEVDGLRFVAILSVFLFHMMAELMKRSGQTLPIENQYSWLERLLANGNRGVDLFFVLSGMMLAMPFARHYLLGMEPVSLRKYYIRRLTRMEPPFVAAMALATLMLAVYWHGLPREFFPRLLASLFYQHGLIYGVSSPVNAVTWSLEIEIQFYVLAPLFMHLFRIPGTKLRRSLLLLCIFATGFAQIPFYSSPRFELGLLFYLQYFLMGYFLADILVFDVGKTERSWLWDVAGSASFASICWAPNDVLWPHIALPAALAILCLATMRGRALRRLLSTRWITLVGGMCYSIYLLHFLLIAMLFKVTRRAILPGSPFVLNYMIQIALVTVPVLLLCAVFYVLIERPCMDPDWPSRLWHELTGRPAVEVKTLDSAGISA